MNELKTVKGQRHLFKVHFYIRLIGNYGFFHSVLLKANNSAHKKKKIIKKKRVVFSLDPRVLMCRTHTG